MTSGPDSLEYRIEQYLQAWHQGHRGGYELLARAIAFQVENGCEFKPGDFRVGHLPALQPAEGA